MGRAGINGDATAIDLSYEIVIVEIMEYICHCFQITAEEIKKLILEHQISSVEELQEHCDAGMGCQSCLLEDLPKFFC